MQIAFLGLGQMGFAIAKLLIEKGHSLTVWNRTASAAKPLADLGAKLAQNPAEAVQHAEVILTMLFDDHAVEEVILNSATLAAIPPNAVHISLSTISVALANRLEAEHAARAQRFLSVPVFGRPNVAAEGKLWLVIGGPDADIAEVKPILNSFSRGSTIVGSRPSQANAVKLAGNFLIASTVASLAEAFTVTESQAIDSAVFLKAANSALYQSAFFNNYGKLMLKPPATAGATINLGLKDTQLFREVAILGATPTPLADLLHDQLETATSAGHGDQDWASGHLEQARTRGKS